MKVSAIIASAAVAVCIALQAWTLNEVVALKVTVAKLEARLESRNSSAPVNPQLASQ